MAATSAIMTWAGMSAQAEIAVVPKAATSYDGFIRVVAYDPAEPSASREAEAPSTEHQAPGTDLGFRLPILAFAGNTVDALSQAFDVKRPKVREPGLIIYAQDGRTNDTRVLVRAETRANGSRVVKIFLPSPGYSDLDDLRTGIARAFIGTEMPDWVIQGVLRSQNDELRRADQRFVLSLWSSARLPFFPALCTDLRVGKGKAAALPGYVAGWIREKKLLGRLMGSAWDGRRLAELLTGETEPTRQDRASDERLARLARSVLEPGECGLWELDFFSSRLMLGTPVFDTKILPGRAFCTFREAIDADGSNLMVRAAAFMKAREVPLYALGRGDDLQAAADAYARFLLGVAGGEPRETLDGMLSAADAKLEAVYEKHGKDNHRER